MLFGIRFLFPRHLRINFLFRNGHYSPCEFFQFVKCGRAILNANVWYLWLVGFRHTHIIPWFSVWEISVVRVLVGSGGSLRCADQRLVG